MQQKALPFEDAWQKLKELVPPLLTCHRRFSLKQKALPFEDVWVPKSQKKHPVQLKAGDIVKFQNNGEQIQGTLIPNDEDRYDKPLPKGWLVHVSDSEEEIIYEDTNAKKGHTQPEHPDHTNNNYWLVAIWDPDYEERWVPTAEITKLWSTKFDEFKDKKMLKEMSVKTMTKQQKLTYLKMGSKYVHTLVKHKTGYEIFPNKEEFQRVIHNNWIKKFNDVLESIKPDLLNDFRRDFVNRGGEQEYNFECVSKLKFGWELVHADDVQGGKILLHYDMECSQNSTGCCDNENSYDLDFGYYSQFDYPVSEEPKNFGKFIKQMQKECQRYDATTAPLVPDVIYAGEAPLVPDEVECDERSFDVDDDPLWYKVYSYVFSPQSGFMLAVLGLIAFVLRNELGLTQLLTGESQI